MEMPGYGFDRCPSGTKRLQLFQRQLVRYRRTRRRLLEESNAGDPGRHHRCLAVRGRRRSDGTRRSPATLHRTARHRTGHRTHRSLTL